MFPQIACIRRCIIALVAYVRLFSTVCFQMCDQSTFVRRCIMSLYYINLLILYPISTNLVDKRLCLCKVESLGTNERIGVQFLTDCNQGGPERSISLNHLFGRFLTQLNNLCRPMSAWPGGKCQGIPLGTPVTFTAEVFLMP